MLNITIIEPCNFVDYPTGGQLAFVKNLLQSFDGELSLVGISTDNEEIGSWSEKHINGKKYKFFSFMKGIKGEKKPLVPLRLQTYINLIKHRTEILNGSSQIILIQAPEVLLSLKKELKNRKICYIFPGIENPIKFSRYFYARIFAKFFDHLFLATVSHANWILAAADSKAINELRLRGKGFNGKSIIQFPTRIDESIFKKIENNTYRNFFNIPEESKVVVTVGRLGYYKGWNLMIDAFRLFLNKYPNSVFFYIGNGEDEDKIKEYIKINNLEEKVILPGFLRNTEIAKYLNFADLFIMGSFLEGWSTTLLEAACMGVPSVVTNFSSSYDIVRDGINGYVVESRDPIEFSKKMELALQIDKGKLPEDRMERFKIKTLKNDLLNIIK